MIEYVNSVNVELVDCLASDDMVAMAAWVSSGADDEERLEDRTKMKGLINFLYRNRHMSPFEHGVFIFKVDVPLFVAREWHRHRTMSYNEVSGRYTEMPPRFYMPLASRPLIQEGKMGNYSFVAGSDDQYAITSRSHGYVINEAWNEYQRQLEAGVAKEVARMVLPLSLMTQFYVTVNPRNLMQFLSLRNDKHALYEIRQAAEQMDEIFRTKMPLTWKAFKRYKIEMVDQEVNTIESKDGSFKLSSDGSATFTGKVEATELSVPPPVFNIHVGVPTDVEKVARYVEDQLNKIGKRQIRR